MLIKHISDYEPTPVFCEDCGRYLRMSSGAFAKRERCADCSSEKRHAESEEEPGSLFDRRSGQ